jgi:hypothetical protein
MSVVANWRRYASSIVEASLWLNWQFVEDSVGVASGHAYNYWLVIHEVKTCVNNLLRVPARRC